MQIAVTGIGLVDSLGSDLSANFDLIIKKHKNCSYITKYDPNKYPLINVKHAHQLVENYDHGLTKAELLHLDKVVVASYYATNKALIDSGINSSKAGVIYSTLNAGTDTVHTVHENILNNKKSSIKKTLSSIRDYITNYISQKFQIQGVNLCITSACASGIVALDYARKLLESGIYDYMIVGGVDLMVDPFSMHLFNSVGALDTSANPQTLPFDNNRKGFIMGEAACCFILEPLYKARHKKIYGIIKGVGLANEAYHDTNMSTEGIGARLAIDQALTESKLSKKDIDIINCHATGTFNGDISEYNVLSDYFPGKFTAALKGNIGHTMGASSLTEIAYGLESLQRNILIPFVKLESPIGHNLEFPLEPEMINMKYMLKNSFGFGGKSGCIIIEKG